MNMLIVAGLAARGGGSGPIWSDGCAMFLLLTGVLSLAVALYLLAKAPKAHPLPIRDIRRR